MKNKVRILYYDSNLGWVEDDYEEESDLSHESDLVSPSSLYADESQAQKSK